MICITFLCVHRTSVRASLLLAHATHSHKFMTLYTKLNEDKKLYVHSCSSMIYFPLRFFSFLSFQKCIQSLFYLWFFCHNHSLAPCRSKQPMRSRVFVLHNLFFCFGSVLFTLGDLHFASIYFNYAHCTRTSTAIISLIWFCTSFASLFWRIFRSTRSVGFNNNLSVCASHFRSWDSSKMGNARAHTQSLSLSWNNVVRRDWFNRVEKTICNLRAKLSNSPATILAAQLGGIHTHTRTNTKLFFRLFNITNTLEYFLCVSFYIGRGMVGSLYFLTTHTVIILVARCRRPSQKNFLSTSRARVHRTLFYFSHISLCIAFIVDSSFYCVHFGTHRALLFEKLPHLVSEATESTTVHRSGTIAEHANQ